MGSEKKVLVRAFERRGFDGFCRGGLRWTSDDPGTVAIVTAALYDVLCREKMLAVREVGEVPLGAKVIEGVLDVPPRSYIDEGAQALDEKGRLERAIQEQKAIKLNAALQAELEALKAEVAAMKAQSGQPGAVDKGDSKPEDKPKGKADKG